MQFQPEHMGQLSEAAYLSSDNVVLYRSIVRYLYHEKERYHSRLSADEIFDALKTDSYFADLEIEKVKLAMKQLTEWGNVTAMQDPRRVRTIEEYKNKVYHYSISERTVVIERAVMEAENLFSEGNTISASLLIRIDRAICRAKEVICQDSYAISEWWHDLQEDFKRLEQSFSDYLHIFYSVEGERLMQSVEFLLYKDQFIKYLRDFIQKLQHDSVMIEHHLLAIGTENRDKILDAVFRSEMDIPRAKTGNVDESRIRNNIIGQWEALHQWFISDSENESTCSTAMECTNEIISKMLRNAASRMQLQNSGLTKRQDYLTFLELFAACDDVQEAHCLSAHVFGAMQMEHYQYHTERETDSIFENAADLQPQIFEIRPANRTYKPRIRTHGFSVRSEEKERKRQERLLAIEQEHRMIADYIQDHKLRIAELSDKVVPEAFRITLLKWIAFANQNQSHTGITDFGQKFRLLYSSEQAVLHCTDGDLTMPDYTILFEEP